jgi:ABC-type phosphate transport system substrate-binding protein
MTGYRRLAVAMIASGLLGIGSLTAPAGLFSSAAGADTDPTTLVGQGGSFFEPVISKLLADDSANINPLFGSYLLTDNDSGIAAFVGSGPGQFTDDFAVSERPLTAAEAATAAANGRSYAYVPIASTPVALATLVPTTAWANSGDTAITSSDFCQHMPLTTTLLGDIFGFDSADPLHNWNDSRITCPQAGGSGTTADGLSVALWANLDPSMANYAMMSLLDSDPTSQALFAAGLAGSGSLTTDTTPSELWPYAQNTIPGGDEPLLGKLLAINSESNAPSTQATTWQLGAIAPISSVWTGAPLGVSWDLPTAAVQNAQGAFVAPSLASAQAAAADATLSATTNPTTNNLVTFNASTTDADAYNSDLMEETYLVVPLNGLSSAKASALAQVVRFILGPEGQQDIESFGAAPATSAMQAAGLKVAAELSAESVSAANPSVAGTTTTSTTSASGAAASATGASGGTSSVGAASDGSGSDSSGSSSDSGLAFTGTADLGAWVGAGVFLLVIGTMLRRLFRRREAQ